MGNHGYGHGHGMGSGSTGREKAGADGKRQMLGHAISLLQALVGILGILGENFEKKG